MYNASCCADVAQSVERILGKDEVAGSTPAISSSEEPERVPFFMLCFPHCIKPTASTYHTIFCLVKKRNTLVDFGSK